MNRRSLRARLLVGAAAAIAAALALAWVAMGYLFEAHAQRSLEASLVQHGRDIVAGLAIAPSGELSVDPPPNDPRFDLPASGLYWQVSAGGQMLRSRSLWDETLRLSGDVASSDWSTGDSGGPFGQRLVFAARTVRFGADRPPVTVALGADHAAVTAARAQFTRELGFFLALLWVVLAAAAWIQVELGLKPLQDVRAALRQMQGQPEARLSDGDYPREVTPLAHAINALADARAGDLERARRRAADLAHSLKTPLAALSAQSRRAREAGAGDAADGLDRAIAAARDVVERELARTRMAAERGAETKAAPVIERLIAVVERTEAGARVAFENAVGEIALPVSEGALMEIAGPLLENAAAFARARVRVGAEPGALWVDDDGPGLDDDKAREALERGRRLDERGPGHGLGLSIVREMADLSGARLLLSRSEWGGLRAEVRWGR